MKNEFEATQWSRGVGLDRVHINAVWKDDSFKGYPRYVVRSLGEVLHKDGYWVQEPEFTRTTEFIESTRFGSFNEAVEAVDKWERGVRR